MNEANELLRQIRIQEAAGATRKVALLRAKLDGIEAPAEPSSTTDMFKDPKLVVEQADSNKKKAMRAKLGDENKPTPSALYQMREEGMSWAEIGKAANVKQPWLTVRKFCKNNDIDYSTVK